MLKAFTHKGWFHFVLLVAWIAIGTVLRFTNLTAKSPWADEFATLVFSIGNNFSIVPLDRPISLDTLLMPLKPRNDADFSAVFHNLMTESTHPPVYFMLNHLWMQLFPLEHGLASLWAARSLSAIFGVASIPAIFGLGWLAFRSRLVGQIAAAMMAVSPYGIYQAQEPRHYTLGILLIIASLSCSVIAARSIYYKTFLPIWVGLIWVVVNSLGIAVHYFFALTLCAEALVLIVLVWQHRRRTNQGRQGETNKKPLYPAKNWRLFAVAVGTLVGTLIWLPAWRSIPDNEVTGWIYNPNTFQSSLENIVRFSAWIVTMLWLLPVEGVSLPIVIACGGLVIIFLFWMLPIFIQSGILLWRSQRLEIQLLGGYVLTVIALFFAITYILSADLSIASRYHFVYFPAFIVVIAAALAVCWNANNSTEMIDLDSNTRQRVLRFLQKRGKKAVVLTWLLGFLGAITVVYNFGYQKIERADILVPIIQKTSQNPVLIAYAYKNYGQTRELMTLGYEFKRLFDTSNSVKNPLFLLAHQEPNNNNSTIVLRKTLAQLPRPFDLWIVNFPRAKAALATNSQNCAIDSQRRPNVNGYKYKLYYCR